MKSYQLSHSEVCRIRNLLCQEICWLEHSGALDPKNLPEGITKRQAERNAEMVGYDRTALDAVTPDGKERLEEYRRGPFARRVRMMENSHRKREKLFQKKYSHVQALIKVVFDKSAKKSEWTVVNIGE